MRSKGYKGRCTKKKLAKCKEVARLYDDLQIAFAEILEKDTEIKEIMVNFYLNDLSIGEFTSDFVAVRTSGDYLVRECVFRKKLLLPRTCKLLDASQDYWTKRGVSDWAIVVEKESDDE